MNGNGRIPTPWKQYWRRFRYATLPKVGFFVFCMAAFWFWGRQGTLPNAIGEVEALQVQVTSAAEGLLMPLAQGQWTLFDMVEPNQVLAQLDDRPARAKLATLTEELGRIHKELDAVADKLAVSESDRARMALVDTIRLRWELEQRSLVVLERQVQVEIDKLELQRLAMRVECLTPLYQKKMVSELEMNEAKMLRDEAARRLAETTKVAGEAVGQQKAAEQRLAKFPELRLANAPVELAPVAAAREVQQARIHEVDVEISLLTIRAPIRGTICAIHCWPGQHLRPGDPVVTLAANHGRFIVSYVRQWQHLDLQPGMEVNVRLRAPMPHPTASVVERVGPQIEPIPVHQCRDPKMPEWGIPVRIALPAEFPAHPGELIDVTFKTAPRNDG